MKTIITFLLAITASFNGFSQNKLNIVVFSDDGEPFYVVVNGIRQNMKAETNVRITDLASESLSFKIIYEDAKIPVISKTQYAPFGMEYTFRIKKDKKGNRGLKYFGEVAIGESTNTGVSTVAYHPTETIGTGTTATTGTGSGTVSTGVTGTGSETVTTTTQTTVVTTGGTTGNTGTTTTGTTNGTGTSENVNVGINMGGVGLNMNVNVNETGGTNSGSSSSTAVNTGVNGSSTGTTSTGGTAYSETVTTTTTSSTTYGGGTTSTGVTTTGVNTSGSSSSGNTVATTGSNTCYYAIADSDYQSIKKSIESKSFEDSKLTMAQQVTKKNCMSSEQIKGIMSMFSFEDSKLTYAKFAYDYCTDKNNYYKVNDEFDFESSIEALDKHISTK